VQVDFGFMMERLSFAWSTGQIDPLPEHAARAAALTTSGLMCGDWLFPPLVNADGLPPAGRLHPQVPTRVFTIEPSHQLVLSGGPQKVEFAQFLITFVGLLKGLRLIPEGWTHFYRVPLRRGALNDLLASDGSIAKAIELATRFWVTNANHETRRGMFGAMHWHLFGQLYEHEFERFNAQYTVLDTCYAIHRRLTGATGQNPPHGERPGLLCAAYNLTVPAWAVRDSTGKFPIAELRNALRCAGGFVDMEILSTIVLLAVAFAFAFMALDASRRAK